MRSPIYSFAVSESAYVSMCPTVSAPPVSKFGMIAHLVAWFAGL